MTLRSNPGETMTGRPAVFATALASLFAAPAFAAGTGMIFISNERSNTISVLNADHEIVETIETCARPRGMRFSHGVAA